MPANRLILLISTIPESVISLNSRFNDGIFNNDRTKRQIDGYAIDANEEVITPKNLCHASGYLYYLCRGEQDPVQAVRHILEHSYEIKKSEYRLMMKDPNSEWYRPEVEII